MSHPLVYVTSDADALFEECESRLGRLRTEGFDVVVAAPDSDGLEAFAARGYDVRPLPGRAEWNVPGWIGAYLILQADFLERKPTLVHGFDMPWAWLAGFAAHRARTPAVIATVESHDFSAPNPVLSNLLARLPDSILERTPDSAAAYRVLGRWVDAYVVHHERDLTELVERRAVPKSKLELLLGGRGVDLGQFNIHDDDLPTPSTLRQRFEIDTAVRTVIGVGGLVSKDATSRFNDLRRALARTHPGVGWLLLSASSEDLPNLANASPEFFHAVDLYVHLDPNDTSGTELMKAAAMRTPAVGASPAARSVIVDHETGRLTDPDGIGDAIVDTLADPKRAADIGIRARARAQERFDRRQIDEQLLKLYDRVLSRSLS